VRVLLVSSYGFPEERRTPESIIAGEIAKRGVHVEALSYGKRFAVERRGRILIHRIPPLRFGLNGRKLLVRCDALFWLLIFLRKRDFDIIHLNYPSTLSLVCSALTRAMRRNARIVITNHDPTIASGIRPLHRSMRSVIRSGGTLMNLLGYVQSVPFRLSDKIVVFSTYERALFSKYGFGNTALIPNPVEISTSATSGDFFERRNIKRPVILNVGRFVPQKGQEFLVRAAPLILKRMDASFVLIGAGGMLAGKLRRLAEKLSVSSRFHFIHSLSSTEVDRAYACCDLFVFPSLFESFGLAAFEAIAHGRRVIAFDIEPLRELLGPSGRVRFVPVGDVDSLADAIVEELSRRDSENDKLRGMEWVKRNFSREVIAAKILELYENLLSKK
jgi:glycosyltransferase involved in cell wall biosynthesis